MVSCTYEEGNPQLMQDLNFLRAMFEADEQFLEVTALGSELSWRVMQLWMKSAGRSLNNFQWRVVANALNSCSLPIFCKLVFQVTQNIAKLSKKATVIQSLVYLSHSWNIV